MNIKINESQFDLVLDMIQNQSTSKKEQFATLIGKIDNDSNLDVESFEIWPDHLLEQTETSVEPKENSWNWVLYNMVSQNCDFVVTLHTHPEWFGSQILDETDAETFKQWSNFFEEKMNNVICINGIAAQNGGLMFVIYDKNTNRFEKVGCQIDNKIIPSTKGR